MFVNSLPFSPPLSPSSAGCKDLVYIDLSYCAITYKGVISLVEGCGQLAGISLQYCGEVRNWKCQICYLSQFVLTGFFNLSGPHEIDFFSHHILYIYKGQEWCDNVV